VTPPMPGQRRPRPSNGTRLAALVLVLIPVVALMWVPSYTRSTPRLWGFPFFYWYQMLWLFLSAVFVVAAYLLLNRRSTGTGTGRDDAGVRR
jgi:membrane protein implicated in regulation of membrane protease activity